MRLSYLYNGNSWTSKMASLYWSVILVLCKSLTEIIQLIYIQSNLFHNYISSKIKWVL